MTALVILLAIAAAVIALAFALALARQASRPRPALPANCGDCVYMLLKAKVYKRETLEQDDGLVHYLCQQRWIEITPYSPYCELGKSRTRTTATPA